MKIKRALVSVSNKENIIDFVRELHKLEIEIISTGGTARAIREAGIPVKDVSEVTGFPEIMDGRVKTLNPMIHGGILARRDKPEHMETLKKHNITPIDLVVANLYPFLEVIKNKNISMEEAIENIDIGGPCMLRASAKNYESVTIVTDPTDYEKILEEIRSNGEVSLTTRQFLALKTFRLTNQYDAAIEKFLNKRFNDADSFSLSCSDSETLRYGENSHQQATFYKIETEDSACSAAHGKILNGKAMSYNNYVDANAALEAVRELPADRPAVTVVKHTIPCGLATGETVAEALARAWEGDPISAFGGVIACNGKVDMDFARFLKGDDVKHYSYTIVNGVNVPQESPSGKFVEVVIAPEFDEEAVEFLKSKSKMLRLIQVAPLTPSTGKSFKAISGGVLVQDKDNQLMSKFEEVTEKKFPGTYKALSEFTMAACKHTKSNAIVLGREYKPGYFQVIGSGSGQPNRVDALRKLAVTKADENLKREFEQQSPAQSWEEWKATEMGKLVLASDAFFPFDDTVKEAASYGIRYILQPGGSMRDKDSVAACDELGIAMALTGLRHFNH
jgi:phosphoribosylaminoimidazolecarboxamide formyltransferase/IMP cyclohydrolase